ncbi:hypothetical protein NKH23_33320, partial [Mesorhizobium sp. M1328]
RRGRALRTLTTPRPASAQASAQDTVCQIKFKLLHIINEEALAYMRGRNLAGPVIDRLAAAPDKAFADSAAWQPHLAALGLDQLAFSRAISSFRVLFSARSAGFSISRRVSARKPWWRIAPHIAPSVAILTGLDSTLPPRSPDKPTKPSGMEKATQPTSGKGKRAPAANNPRRQRRHEPLAARCPQHSRR